MGFVGSWSQNLLGSLLASAEGNKSGFSLMQIDPGTIFWTLIIFTCVVVILWKVAWGPILNMAGEREKRIRESVERADQARAEAEKYLTEQKELVARQRKEAADIVTKARDEARHAAEEILAKGRKEADEQAARARRQIEEEKTKAIEAIRAQTVDLVLAAATHLLGKTLDEESHRKIVKEYIQKLPGNLTHH